MDVPWSMLEVDGIQWYSSSRLVDLSIPGSLLVRAEFRLAPSVHDLRCDSCRERLLLSRLKATSPQPCLLRVTVIRGSESTETDLCLIGISAASCREFGDDSKAGLSSWTWSSYWASFRVTMSLLSSSSLLSIVSSFEDGISNEQLTASSSSIKGRIEDIERSQSALSFLAWLKLVSASWSSALSSCSVRKLKALFISCVSYVSFSCFAVEHCRLLSTLNGWSTVSWISSLILERVLRITGSRFRVMLRTRLMVSDETTSILLRTGTTWSWPKVTRISPLSMLSNTCSRRLVSESFCSSFGGHTSSRCSCSSGVGSSTVTRGTHASFPRSIRSSSLLDAILRWFASAKKHFCLYDCLYDCWLNDWSYI